MILFSDYANYYDLLYKDKKYLDEVEYLKKILLNNDPEIKKILELGCGTGLHAIGLAKAGIDVTCIDKSQRMLDLAKDRISKDLIGVETDKIELKLGDARTYSDNKKYDAVISIFHVASYQLTNNDISEYLRTAQNHLKNGGIFIYDFWYGPAVLTQKPENRIKRYSDDRFRITRISESRLLENDNRVDVNFEIQISNISDESINVLNEIHPMRYFFMLEMDYFLKKAGFNSWEAEEWLTGNTPSVDTWGVCIIAKK